MKDTDIKWKKVEGTEDVLVSNFGDVVTEGGYVFKPIDKNGNSAVCDVKSGIDKVAGAVGFSSERVINAVQSGDAAVTSALQNCCCQTQQSILKMGYENQLANCNQTNTLQNGQQSIINALTQGFSATNYERQKQTCDILQAGQNNTLRIVDVLNQHWQADLQQRYNDARLELSQQRQNAELIAALKTTTTTTATA